MPEKKLPFSPQSAVLEQFTVRSGNGWIPNDLLRLQYNLHRQLQNVQNGSGHSYQYKSSQAAAPLKIEASPRDQPAVAAVPVVG